MKIRSAKTKGRRACQRFVDKLLKAFPSLNPEDLYICPSSVNGPDITFSKDARATIGHFVPEVKCVEKLNIWSAIAQAERLSGASTPLVVFSRNHSDQYVTLKADDFIEILGENRDKR